MKKVITITLGGIIYSIEDEAHQKLADYLSSIRHHYSPDEGKDIIDDIESNIADKFSEMKFTRDRAVDLSAVEKIIKDLGTVEQFSKEADEQAIIDSKDETADHNSPPKRLYRNPDDIVVAGVCSGMAAYFDIDPVFIRILFILMTLLNGFGILAYIILWLVVPEAKTSTQRLEMRGAAVNLKKIEQAIKQQSDKLKIGGEKAFSSLKNGKSWFYKIINFPIKIIQSLIWFLRKVIKVTIPIVRIVLGIVLIIAALATILGITLSIGIMLFNINSPYIHSDIPLSDFVNQASYYFGMIGVYLVALIPFLFLLLGGISLSFKKNYFRVTSSIIMVVLWMIAVSVTTVAAIDLVPQVKEKYDQSIKQNTITRDYEFSDINSLRVGLRGDVTVEQGDEFLITVTGHSEAIDRLSFDNKEGELNIVQSGRVNKLCLFCFDRPLDIKIVTPELNKFIGFGSAKVNISGFANDMQVNAGESSRITITAQGQNISSYIAGVSGLIEIINSPKQLTATLEGFGRLRALDLTADKISINQSVLSRVTFGGLAKELVIVSDDSSSLDAFNLSADKIDIKASDSSRLEVLSTGILKVIAEDFAKVYYRGNPLELDLREADGAKVEPDNTKTKHINYESDDMEIGKMMFVDKDGNQFVMGNDSGDMFFSSTMDEQGRKFDISIKADGDIYSPTMSSRRGIGFIPAISGPQNDIIFKWRTNAGYLVEGWEQGDVPHKIVANDGGEVFWTFGDDQNLIVDKPDIFIEVSAMEPDTNEEFWQKIIRFDWQDDITVRLEPGQVDIQSGQ